MKKDEIINIYKNYELLIEKIDDILKLMVKFGLIPIYYTDYSRIEIYDIDEETNIMKIQIYDYESDYNICEINLEWFEDNFDYTPTFVKLQKEKEEANKKEQERIQNENKEGRKRIYEKLKKEFE